MSTRRQLVEPDVYTDEVHAGEDSHPWPDTADSGNPSPDSTSRSSVSLKLNKHTLSSVVVDRALLTNDRLVPTTPNVGARRAGRRQDKITLNGLEGQDVAYDCSKFNRQGANVVKIMT